MPFNDTMQEVPQSQTDAIARRLLGDDLVDKYGDVIGARKTGPADVLRDFTIGMHQGAGKVDELHAQVQDQFEKSYNQAATRAIEAKKADIAKGQAFIGAIKTIQGLPPGHRAAVLKETLDQMGIPYSGAAIKMFTDSDMLGNVPLGELENRVNDGTISTNDIAGVMGSGTNAAQFMQNMARKKQDDQATSNMILSAENTRIRNQAARLKLKTDKSLAPLSIKNAQLRGEVMQKALDKNTGITGIPEIDNAIRAGVMGQQQPNGQAQGTPTTPVPGNIGQGQPTVQSQAQPLAAPAAGNDVEAAKARLGLK